MKGIILKKFLKQNKEISFKLCMLLKQPETYTLSRIYKYYHDYSLGSTG